MDSVAAKIAVAANTDGEREIAGLHIGPSEAEAFWGEFLASLHRHGLRGTRLIISDAHEGLKAAIRRVFAASWQRCRVPSPGFMPGVPSGTDRSLSRPMDAKRTRPCPESPDQHGSGRPAPSVIQLDRKTASQMLRHVADQLRPKCTKLAAFIDTSEADVLSYVDFPAQHRTKIHSTNPIERLSKEVKRRVDVVGIFPNEASIIRLIGAVLLKQNDEWQLQHRYMQVEATTEITAHRCQQNSRSKPGSLIRGRLKLKPHLHQVDGHSQRVCAHR